MESGQPGPQASRAAHRRDLALVVALVALGAFAPFDGLRRDGDSPPRGDSGDGSAPVFASSAIAGWPVEAQDVARR